MESIQEKKMSSSIVVLRHGYPTLGEIAGAIAMAIAKTPFYLAKQVFCKHEDRRPYDDTHEECRRCGKLIRIYAIDNKGTK
jgi:hypothetical protein